MDGRAGWLAANERQLQRKLRMLAETVIELTGSRSRIEMRPLPADDPRQRQPDIEFAKTRLEWVPRTQLREGLTATIEYFESSLA